MLRADDVSCEMLQNHEKMNMLEDWAEFRHQSKANTKKARKDWISNKSSD